jgi:hypothetical protein
MWVLVILICTGMKCEARLTPGFKTEHDCQRTAVSLEYKAHQRVGMQCMQVKEEEQGAK